MREKTAGKRLLALNLALLLLLTLLPITALAAELTPGETVSYTVNNDGDTHETLTFTPSDTGFYQLAFEKPAGCGAWGIETDPGYDTTGADMFLYSRADGESREAFCEDSRMSCTYFLEAGTTYEFYLTKNPNSEIEFTDNGTWTATLAAVTPRSISLDQTVTVDETENASSCLFTFQAPETGVYTMTDLNGWGLRVYDSNGEKIVGGDSRTFVTLEQGQQVYIQTNVWHNYAEIQLSITKPVSSGSFGANEDNLTWNWDPTTGCLTISGEGSMGEFDDEAPWNDFRDRITAVVIEPGVTDIAPDVFRGYDYVTDVTIPGTVTAIGSGAFGYCNNLTNVEIANGVSRIGADAFRSCRLNTLELPDSVTSIGARAFYDCWRLRQLTLPGSLTSVGREAFSNVAAPYLEIPGSLAEVGEEAFYNVGASAVKLNEGVQHIEASTFASSGNLTLVAIPESLTQVDDNAFGWCDNLSDVYYAGSEEQWNAISFGDGNWDLRGADIHCNEQMTIICQDGILYAVQNGEAKVMGTTDSNSTSLVVPAEVEGYPVTAVLRGAFSGASNLRSIELPDSVTTIDDYAFYDCYYMHTVKLPANLASIGESAFRYCYNLQDLSLPAKLRTIGTGAFYDCDSLVQVTIPASVTMIAADAFSNCYRLQSIQVASGSETYQSVDGVVLNRSGTEICVFPSGRAGEYVIPDGVTVVRYQQFCNCFGLESVVVPSSVSAIEPEAFINCGSLKTVTISEGTKRIAEFAFNDCSSLESITIPASVTIIGDYAFGRCYSLTDVYYGGSRQSWNAISVAEGNSWLTDATIHYGGVSLAITTQPKNVSTVEGKTATMKVVAEGENLTYQWQYQKSDGSWANTTLTGAKTATLKIPATVARNGNRYRCVVKSGGESVTSNAAKLTVFGIKTQPKDVSATAGKTAAMKVVAVGENLTYQWQYQKSDGSWANTTLTGAKTDTLKITATVARNGNVYRCVVKSGNNTINSDPATLKVFGIKTQPKDVSAVAGKTVTMKVVATGENLTYQWQYQKSDGSWANTTLTGAKTDTLKIPATVARNGNVYRCVVKSGSSTVNSDGAKLTVFGIKTQPVNVSAPIGKTVTMKVVATGTNLTYQWQYQKSDGSWANTTLSGAKTATLKIPVTAARNGNVYRCVVKSGSNTINSNGAKLTVFAIKTQPKDVTAAKGATATMKVVATGTSLTYQWQYLKSDGTWANTTLTGAKTATLSIPATAARNGNQYRCVVKSGTSTITSNAAKLTVK